MVVSSSFAIDDVQNSEQNVLQAVEQQQVDLVQAFYDALQIKELKLESALNCPIGVSYFSRFLSMELGTDGLITCNIDLKSIIDYVAQVSQTPEDVPLKASLIEKLQDLQSSYFEENSQHDLSSLGIDKITIISAKFMLVQSLDVLNGKNTSIEKMKEQCDAITVTCQTIQAEVFKVLQEPFAQFLKSELFRELCALILNYDYNKSRDMLLSAGSDGKVINIMHFNHPKGYNARHPQTVVTELLQIVIDHISNEQCWKFNEELSEIQVDFEVATKIQVSNCCSWAKFEQKSAELAHVDLSLIQTRDEKLAFFINVYNLMMIHASVISGGVPQTSYGRDIFLRKLRYNIAGNEYSLDDVEYGILRGNPSTSFLGSKRRIAKNDSARIIHVLNKIPTKTLTFCLANLSTHGPFIQPLSPQDVEQEMYKKAKNYVLRHTNLFDEADLSYLVVPTFLYTHGRELLGITVKEAKQYNDKLAGFIIEQYFHCGKLTELQNERWAKKEIKLLTATSKNNLTTDYTCLLTPESLGLIKRKTEPVFKKPKPKRIQETFELKPAPAQLPKKSACILQ